MSNIRLLIGTRKGAFILTSDGMRKKWRTDGPYFGGWEIFHMKGSPVDSQRLYASQTSSWFGQIIQRSCDGGKTWEPPGTAPDAASGNLHKGESNKFIYEGETGNHLWYDGTPRPWQFKRVWHLEPSLTDPEVVFAGVEDAALFRSGDGGATWQELPSLRSAKGHLWQPGAGGMGLHTILLSPGNPNRIFVAISAAGVFRTDDAGATWRPVNRGLKSAYELPDPNSDVGHCVHRIAMHPSRPNVLFMQKHWGVNRSDDAGESWLEVSGNLPSDFGFPIEVHSHEPETIYVIPMKSDSEHYPPDGRLRVYRSRSGGGDWESVSKGLPQRNCYVDVLRDATSVDSLDPCGIYFGTTGGQLYASSDSGNNWTAIARNLPPILSVEAQTLA